MRGLHWYLLIHQLPPKPLYLRAKIRQRLAKVGAVALKKSVYVLPHNDECLEDLQWIVKEAVAGGGEAHICEADFIGEGLDEELVERFNRKRNGDYEVLTAEIRELARKVKSPSGVHLAEQERSGYLTRIKKQLDEITAIDFFRATKRKDVEKLLRDLEVHLRRGESRKPKMAGHKNPKLIGRTWVTRKDLHIDRIASAWLIRRFLDPKARFRFVDQKNYEKKDDEEIRFDMAEGEFTHEGNHCTFETLLARTGIADPALAQIGEIVHDIDLKDGKYGRSEVRGIEQLVRGLVLAHPDDESRLDRGFALFDDLYGSFRKRSRKG